MNEENLKFNRKNIDYFLSIENFRIPEMLFVKLDVYLQHILNSVAWNKD